MQGCESTCEPTKTSKGYQSERLVEQRLALRGWVLCRHRWRTPWAEVDLVFQKKGRLLMVEVKSLADLGFLATAVSSKQKRRLQRVLENVTEANPTKRVELVLAVVLPNKSTHWFPDFLTE